MLTKKSQRSKGFTLVELLVSIAILAVLATVSVVGYISFIEKSAVSTDNYLVTQLNDLAKLYEIEHTGSFEESDVRRLVKNAGITSLELKSESYDYRLYFNQNNNKFILTTEDYSNDEKYLLIDDGFLSEVDSGNMGEGNEGEGDNNTGEVNPPTSGDQETGEGEPTVPDTPEVIEPNLVLQDFEIMNLTHKRYVKAENGVINVGVNISEEEQLKTTFSFTNIVIIDTNTNIVWNVINYIMDGKEITKAKYEFTEIGEKTLTVIVTHNNVTKSIDIPIKVWNANLPEPVIIAPPNKAHSIKYVLNDDNSYNITVIISEFLSTMITDARLDADGVENIPLSENRNRLESMEVYVCIQNNTNYKKIELEYTNKLSVNFENININDNNIVCSIVYRYQGMNGKWCEATVEIAKELK